MCEREADFYQVQMGVKEGVRYLFRHTSLGLEGLRLVGDQPTKPSLGMQQCQDRGGHGDFRSLSLETRRLRLHRCPFRLERVFVERCDQYALPSFKVFSQVELC